MDQPDNKTLIFACWFYMTCVTILTLILKDIEQKEAIFLYLRFAAKSSIFAVRHFDVMKNMFLENTKHVKT